LLHGRKGASLLVTVERIIETAPGVDPLSVPEVGDRFVGVVIDVTDSADPVSEDINADTGVLGSDGKTYAHDDDLIAGCTNFTSGDLRLQSGSTLSGCVTFQLPVGIVVDGVDFTPTAGAGGGDIGQWSIG
jgi:hypothetical protein